MKALIPVSGRAIAGAIVQTVNARDLHEFLGVQTAFKDWIARRVADYGFSDGQDFCSFLSESQGGRPAKEYAISLDMAKELSMVERTAKGKEARQYFIDCERRANERIDSEQFEIPKTLSSALRLAASQAEQIEQQQAVIEQQSQHIEWQRPAVAFHEAVNASINGQTIEEVAKELGTGRNRLYVFLRSEGVFKQSNLPYQRFEDAGYFRVILNEFKDARGEPRTAPKVLVTGKGVIFIQKMLAPGRVNMAA